jgi:hypothetical protein
VSDEFGSTTSTFSFAKTLRQEIDQQKDKICCGIDVPEKYWENVGYMKGMRRALDLFVKQKEKEELWLKA